jgi:putative ABC transport system permease protein
VSRTLRRKLRRDVWRARWRFGAIAAIMAIGVAVFVAATDGYQNLDQSFERSYTSQRLPDAIVSGPGAAGLHAAVAEMAGSPLVDVRHQADVGIRLNGHAVYGRAVGIPASGQPNVSLLDMHSGTLPGAGQVVIEQHLAGHYHLAPGDVLEVLGRQGWQPFTIAGTALSTEYLWPARSPQEVLTTPEDFGVVFLRDDELLRVLPRSVEQLAVYAHDRSMAESLTAAVGTLAQDNGLQFLPREQQPSFHTLRDDVMQFGSLAGILPWLFLAAVVLGTYVLLSRIVTAQRAVIGTLIANGLSPPAARRHYLGYGLACAAVGIPPGLFGGYLLGQWITAKYTAAIALPMHLTSIHPLTYLLAAVAVTVVALSAAVAPANTAARMQPAAAMRVAPPQDRRRRTGRPIWPGRIPARWRMVLRSLLRNRRRTVFTVTGVAVSVILVMVFAGMRDTLPGMVDRQFGQIAKQDGELVVSGSADTVTEKLRRDRDVTAAEPYSAYGASVSAGTHRYQTLLIGLAPQSTMHSFPAESGSHELSDDGVLLGVGLRELLAVSLGDRIDVVVPQSGVRLTERVAGFVDEPFSPVVYISLNKLAAQTASLPVNGVLITLRAGSDARAAGDRIAALPGVVAYRSATALAATMRQAFGLYDTLVGIMLVFAAVMAAALLYNAMSANVSERLGELGAVHAEGMGAGMLSRLIAAENVAVALIGLPFGLVGGVLLADRLLSTYHSLGYPLRLEMHATTPMVVALAMLGAAAMAQLPMVQRIHRLDLARIVRERAL